MKIALIFFTKNEKENLDRIFRKVPIKLVDNVYAVDGGSKDGTLDFFKKNNVPVLLQKYSGVGGAYDAAFSKTKEDALIFFHPDGNMNPKDIKKFASELKKGREFVVATRMTKGGRNEEDNQILKPRKWFCQILGVLANIIFSDGDNKTSDITQGYRAITRSAYMKMKIERPNPIAPDFEQIIEALKNNIKITEFPTIEGKRKFGYTSMTSFKTGLANIKVLLKQI